MRDGVKPAMGRRGFLLGCGSVGLVMAGVVAGAKMKGRARAVTGMQMGGKELMLVSRKSRALGSDIEMMVMASDRGTGEKALDAAFGELARVERVMSIYLPESEISRLNREGALRGADEYLLRVLEESRSMAEKSGGAFDVTVQPLWEIYAAANKNGELPTVEQVRGATRLVDWRGVSVSGSEVKLKERGMSVTLNGIAQGFAADRAMEALKRHGIEHALVNTGELASLGQKKGGENWTVGIQHPRKADAYLGLAKLAGRCMSTSGDYETSFSVDKKYNHIFEPWTGRSPEEFSSVTVVAPNATLADALSTAIFVLGAEKGMELVEGMGVDVLLVTKDGKEMATSGFPWA